MYYSATYAQSTNHHCNGAAISNSAVGPYTPLNTTLGDCQIAIGGSIDAAGKSFITKQILFSWDLDLGVLVTTVRIILLTFHVIGFQDFDGSRYVVYKIDGNSNGHGGTCGNTVAPIVATPIQLLRLNTDAITPIGAPVTILQNGQYDGPLVEAPSLIRVMTLSIPPRMTYVLFFSSNCYSTPAYDTSYATSNSLMGPYTKSKSPLLVTGTDGLVAPGGATASADGSVLVYHAYCGADLASGRCMHERRLTISGNTVQATLL